MTSPVSDVKIGTRLVGPSHPCFVIAEAGVNHNGDVQLAHALVDKAAEIGADAVKFQSFVPEELVTAATPKAEYQEETTGAGGGQLEMLRAITLSAEAQAELKAHCDEAGILYMCTPYEHQSVDMLDALGVDAYKIASTDTTNTPLLRYVAGKGRVVILSTGMCELGEVEEAVRALEEGGIERRLILLHCLAEYPAPPEEANLNAIKTLAQAFGRPAGFSDHTEGIGVSPYAVAIGACCIEKHFTLDKDMPGPDHRASLDGRQFKELIERIRMVEAALGDGVKRIMPSESGNKSVMQKSVVSRRRLEAGARIEAADLACKRPAGGLRPSELDSIVGLKTAQPIEPDQPITPDQIAWK